MLRLLMLTPLLLFFFELFLIEMFYWGNFTVQSKRVTTIFRYSSLKGVKNCW